MKVIIEQSEQFTKPQLQSVKSAFHREKCLANAAKAEKNFPLRYYTTFYSKTYKMM